MAASLGGLVVRIGADTANLRRGLDDAARSTQSFSGRLRASAMQVAKWGAAIASAAAALGTVLVRNSLKAIDSLAKTADKLGETTEGLINLRYAAEQTGVAAGTMDMAMQRMTRRIAEAAQGGGVAKDAIEQLGLEARELANMRPEEAFRAITRAMEGVTSQSERVRLAFKFFDSEGVALVNTLELGTEGLEAMAREAEALGLHLSRVDAAKVEKVNDAITRVRSVIEGVVNRITVRLAPIISGIADLITEWSIASNAFQEHIDSAFRVAISGARRVADAIAIVRRGISLMLIPIKAIQAGFANLDKIITNVVVDAVEGIRALVNAAIRGLNLLGAGLEELGPVSDSLLGRLQKNAERAAEKWAYSWQDAKRELDSIMNDPLPSTMIDKFLEDTRQKMEEFEKDLEERSANRGTTLENILGIGGGKEEKAAEKHREALEQALERIREYIATEEELAIKRFEERMALLREMREQELISQEEFNQLEFDLAAKHGEELLALRTEQARREAAAKRKAEAELTKIQEAEQRARLQGFSNFAQNALALGSSLFEDNKILAVAQALLAAREAIVSAYAWGASIGGPPMGAAAAAAAAAATAAQVAAVKSTTVSGGGSSRTGAGGSVSTPAPVEPAQPQPINRTIHLNVVGDVFNQRTIREIAEQINELSGDGFRVKVHAG